MIQQPENQSMEQPNVINDALNQSSQANQANDPELYPTMKRVIDVSKQKVLFEDKKEEEEAEDGKLIEDKSGSVSAKRKIDYNRLNEEFKDIFNKQNSNINDNRRCLIHFIIVVSVFNCIVWEIDCLFLNVCYGENKEMNIKISALLFPLIILSIIILYFLYETINYLREIPIKICIIIYALISAFFVGLGIASLVIGLKHQYKMEDNLTEYEKNYYENIPFFNKYNDAEKNLEHTYKVKMAVTGALNIFLGLLGFIIIIKSIIFNSLLAQTTFDWRPPLRSHIRVSRIKKAIELYTQNSESYLNLFRAENPHYQIDEFDNKDKNRFGAVKGSVGDSLDVSKDKKSISNNINNINNEEEIVLPKAIPRKIKNKGDKKSQSNEENNKNNNNNENEINTNTHNLINNNINNENEINTNTHNLINNNINNENENENEINTKINNEINNDNKEEI